MFDPGYHLFLLIVIPIILFDCWFAFNREDNELAVFIVSILMVVFGLPHLLAIPALFNGNTFLGIAVYKYIVMLLMWGVITIAFGIRGILYVVR